MDGWLTAPSSLVPHHHYPETVPIQSLSQVVEEEQRQRRCIETAAGAVRRMLAVIHHTNDSLSQQWYSYSDILGPGDDDATILIAPCRQCHGGLQRLNLYEQFNIEIVFLWVKQCILRVQMLTLFALDPDLSPKDRRRWCKHAFRVFSDWCVTL